jgi:hypothetical protein
MFVNGYTLYYARMVLLLRGKEECITCNKDNRVVG